MDEQTPDHRACETIAAAAEAVRHAREELHEAMEFYQKVRQQAGERWKQVRQTTVGEMADGGLEIVRKYPGAGLLAAVLAGFFLGRWTRR